MKRRYTIVLELDDLDGAMVEDGPMVPHWQVDDEAGTIAERGFSRHLRGLFLTLAELLREDFEGGRKAYARGRCAAIVATSPAPSWCCLLPGGHDGEHVYGSIPPPDRFRKGGGS